MVEEDPVQERKQESREKLGISVVMAQPPPIHLTILRKAGLK
jgi:hypothetical protein